MQKNLIPLGVLTYLLLSDVIGDG